MPVYTKNIAILSSVVWRCCLKKTIVGREEATRTPDPHVPNVVRYQLRYFSSKEDIHYIIFRIGLQRYCFFITRANKIACPCNYFLILHSMFISHGVSILLALAVQYHVHSVEQYLDVQQDRHILHIHDIVV